MKHAFGLDIPQTLEDVCHSSKTALLVYDMQVDIFRQAESLTSITPQVLTVIEAARAAHMHIFFSRHMSLPNHMAGRSQLRTAMAWQHAQEVEDIQPHFLRDSDGFALLPELHVQPDEVIFDKIGMSFFGGTPLNSVLRDCDINSFIIVGAVLEIGIAPTVSHGVDLGYIPVIVADACGSVDKSARKRTLATIEYMQTSLVTDTKIVCHLLSTG